MWNCRPSAWILPGLLTVGFLLLLAMILRSGHIEQDLTKRALERLSTEHSWASVELDGRDLTLSGVAPSAEAKAEALKLADGVFTNRDTGTWGVRVVDGSTIDELAIQSPFVTSGKFDGSSLTLSGYVGSDAATGSVEKVTVEALPGVDVVNELQAGGGAPEGVVDQVGFAVAQIKGLASGEFKLTDSSLDISGVAKDNASFDSVTAALAGSLPAGLTLGSSSIIPPVASPYTFSGAKTADSIVLSGSVPSDEVRQALVAKAGEIANGASVSDEMVLASGASDEHQARASFALDQLGQLAEGNASVSDATFNISGNMTNRPAETSMRAAFDAGLPAGLALGTVGLTSPDPAPEPTPAPEPEAEPEPAPEPEPEPVVFPYIFGAQKTADGITLEGSVPSEDVRAALVDQASKATSGSVTDNLSVTDDAPANFAAMTAFGLAQFGSMDTGEISTFDDTLSLSGSAKSPIALGALEGALNAVPEGVNLGSVNLGVTPVSPYVYGAKVEAGSTQVTLSGHVPSSDAKNAAVSHAQGLGFGSVADEMQISAGASEGFAGAATYAANQVANFAEGSVDISDTNIRINGIAKDNATYAAALAAADTPPEGFTVVEKNIGLPVASPYLFSSVKSGNDVSYNGNVPSDAVKIGLSGGASAEGWNAMDDTSPAAGAPSGFANATSYANSMIKNFSDGSVRIKDTEIAIDGTAISASAYDVATEAAGNPPEGFTVVSSDIELPIVSPYVWSATRNGSEVTLEGFIPSNEVREATVGAIAGVVENAKITDNMELALGQPANVDWGQATGFAAKVVGQISEGEVSYADAAFSARGSTDAVAAYDRALGLIADGRPDGVTEDKISITAPAASPFTLGAVKEGAITISGFSPSPQADIVIGAAAKRLFGDTLGSVELTRASGAPAGYSSVAVNGLEGLSRLERGRLELSDTNAKLSGVVPFGAPLDEIKQGFETGVPEGFAATADLVQAQPPAPVTPEQCSDAILEAVSKNKVFFEKSKAGILSDSFGLLDGIAAQLLSCPTARFEIGGHTDSDGSANFNQRLSEARAQSVLNYLTSAGVAADRLSAVGYGETRPIVVNNSSANKALNRRIEFTLVQAN